MILVSSLYIIFVKITFIALKVNNLKWFQINKNNLNNIYICTLYIYFIYICIYIYIHIHIHIFIYVVPDFVWSFQNRNLDANPKVRELKRNYLECNKAYKRNMEECMSLHLKVKNIKDWLKQSKFSEWTYSVKDA